MRRVLAWIACSLVLVGCARVLGIDFGSYREGDAGAERVAPQPLECVPNETSRCLCELSEGVRGCDDAGRLLPCICSDTDAATSCGNGTLDEGEACDDGDLEDGNGCSSSCVPDGRPASVEQCPGQPTVAWSSRRIVMTLLGSLRATPSDAAGTCGASPQPDRVFQLIPTTPGKLEITVTPSVDTFVSLRAVCTDAASALSCALAPAGLPTVREIDTVGAQELFLILEPLVSSPGATFSVEIAQL